jgi:BirA family transcriptional regulator, biotin operon repressor / biotin---[acetyl-CoA-carboxylase] ligase
MTRLGLPRVHHRVLDSTNERAKALARAGAPHGTLVSADEQTAGRGRQGRAWVAPPGSCVLASVIVRGLEDRHAVLPLTAAVAVCEAAEASAPVKCSIKWPNDVWVEARKLAGILIEGRPQEGWAVLGVGLNVTVGEFPGELKETATSLALESRGGALATREAVLGELLRALGHRLDEDPAAVLDAWRARDALCGRHITWNGGEGIAAGIDDRGALLVDTPDGPRVSLDAGEVHLGRVAGGSDV